MRRLIYASSAVHDFDESELIALLQGARATNTLHQVTGMLVCSAGSFLQLIEGEDAAIEVVWDRIRLDPRHSALRVIADGPAQERLFGSWAMGFEHPDREQLERSLPGYRASMDYPFVSAQLIAAAETAETLLSLYARRSD